VCAQVSLAQAFLVQRMTPFSSPSYTTMPRNRASLFANRLALSTRVHSALASAILSDALLFYARTAHMILTRLVPLKVSHPRM
jgi:hypothetical protein